MTFARSIVWIVGLMLLSTLAADALAREATLKLQDGRKITGDLVAETADTVILKVAGIETTFPREQIVTMEIERTLTEQFTEQRAKIKDDDYNARYLLARKMFDTRSTEGYKLASRELDSILAADPEHRMAKLLKNVVKERLKLQPDKPDDPKDPVRPVDPKDPDPVDPVDPVEPGEGPRKLTKDEINLIKVWETRLQGARPNVVVPRKVLEEILDKFQAADEMVDYRGRSGRQKFLSLPGHEQLRIIFALRARDYYDDVIIRTEPDYITEFRQKIHRQLVIGHCGKCHGEGKAKGFWVVTRPAVSEQTAMQNLMLLRTTSTATAFNVISPQTPTRSPLLQYAMPRKSAATPHPDVKGFQPYFRNGVDDPRYKAARSWLEKTLYREDGGYPGIAFKPPAGYGSKQAATVAPPVDDKRDELPVEKTQPVDEP